MKKGVSIAIETVIYIILAVLVLTILLYFFTSQSGPAQQEISLQTDRNKICGIIANNDPKCEDMGGADVTTLKKVCASLKLCTGSEADAAECIKKCCIFCLKA